MFERTAFPNTILRDAILGPITLDCSILVDSPIGWRRFPNMTAFSHGSLEALIGQERP
ncbi:hypothetical protein [Alteriqipengyuania lutimaris]|uniref:hypothetical protein n=1 Tax=Alteriqipengyuania lutimaris TaxID=1538146 RepID=UPI0015F18767|nr:hypothetical protein [Alteriqipengyuania lutimaris]MBB3034701.1 hypothetical protein [Alteriqipengyuania lutimaris]